MHSTCAKAIKPPSEHHKTVLESFDCVKSCLLVYYVEFPFQCSTYDGPFEVECLNAVYLSSGCTTTGYDFPSEASTKKHAAWAELNLQLSNFFLLLEVLTIIWISLIYLIYFGLVWLGLATLP